MLGKDQYTFARTYCNLYMASMRSGGRRPVATGGVRLEELRALLSSCVMIRRLKVRTYRALYYVIEC